MRVLPTLACSAAALSLGAAALHSAPTRPTPPDRDPAFRASARELLEALRASDWNALRKSVVPRLVIGEYYRLYPQFIPEKDRDQFTSGQLFGKSAKPGRYSVSLMAIDSTRPLGKAEREAFDNFCRWVKRSRSQEASEQGRGFEVPELVGPGIECLADSNLMCRVEMEKSTGRWRVSRLILEAH